MALLENTKEHPTAEAIYEKIRRQIPNISLGTVYRNIAFLADTGKIIKIRVGDETLHFDARTHEHYHWRCRVCGKVEDLEIQIDPSLKEEAERLTGAVIERQDLSFTGVCRECMALPERI